MITIAYIDTRPFIYVLAIPTVLLASWIIGRLSSKRWNTAPIFGVLILLFTAAYGFFMYGPYVGYTKMRTYAMTWHIGEPSPQFTNDTHVVLTFQEYPGYHIGYYSKALAEHLSSLNTNAVDVLIEMTMDYGKMRGYHEIDIGGFTNTMGAAWSYGGSHGNDSPSPWEAK
ncbi:MAG: hypothetical protein K8T26_06755 [Lentisphaerae bacterium]|nr:hypothetical protein [Lentisphaerota bacterium]